MYIKKAQLDNYGKFHHRTICFAPGLNVVYGENESGKSTLQSFLVGMLFGMEKQRGRAKESAYQRYEPWNTASYYTGSMEFCVADKDFTIERNFYHREKTVRLYHQADQEELSVDHGDLDMLLGGVRKEFYENTYCISQAAVVTEETFGRQLQQELANVVHGGEAGIDVRQAIRQLEGRRKLEEQRLKRYRQQKKECLERLEWEKELLWEDIRQLEQKIAASQKGERKEGTADTEQKAAALQRGQKEDDRAHTAEKQKGGWVFRIPVIGWILWVFCRIWRSVRKYQTAKSRAGMNSDVKGGHGSETVANHPETTVEAQASVADLFREQLEEKQMRLTNVLEESEEQRGVSGEERKILAEQKSIQLALDTLERVAGESYRDKRDDIREAVSGILTGITGGKYDRLELAEDGQLMIYAGDRCLSPWQLSRGTMEQLYLALRLGVGRCMIQEEPLPVLLDETFCAYDELRLSRTLKWLADKQDNQIILFTCQQRELQLLEKMGIAHHRILL